MIQRFSNFTQKPSTKKVILGIWIALVAAAIVLYFVFPRQFSAKGIKEFLAEFNSVSLLVYSLICLTRGLFLIPSTPFVLAGAMLFPDSLVTVFIISIVGILGSGTFIYFAAQFLDFGEKKAKKISMINEKIQKHGFWIVLGWAFFPIVPTDLICYVAGKTRIHFWKYLTALFIGEALLIAFYLRYAHYFLT